MTETENNTPAKVGRPRGAKDLQPRKKRTDLSKYGNENLKPGDTARYLEHNLKAMNLPPIDCNDREQVERRIAEYFQLCIDDDVKPGVAGLCLSLGIDRRTWYSWGTGIRRKGEYMDIVARTRLVMESILETYMQHGQINPIPAIFLMKNHFGYRDQSEVVLTPSNPMGDVQDVETLRRKYLESAAIVDELPEEETGTQAESGQEAAP